MTGTGSTPDRQPEAPGADATADATPVTNDTTANTNADAAAADGNGAAPKLPGSRFAPNTSFNDFLLQGRGRGAGAPATGGRGFGERGGGRGRGRGGRGHGDGSGPDPTIVRAMHELATAPSLPTTSQQPPAPQSTPANQPANQPANTVQPTVQQGSRAFADVAAAATLPQLEPLDVPADVLEAAGLPAGIKLPLLPKKDAHRYVLPPSRPGGPCIPFVTTAPKNFDSVRGYLTELTWFKRAAVLNAARVVIVRTEVATSMPYIFIYDVQPVQPAGLLETRIQLVTMQATTLDVAGLAPPPPPSDGSVLYLLQGTKSLLAAHARKVILRSVIAGADDDTRVYEATGYPSSADWQMHLLGCPLHLVQEWAHAPRRATVKPTFDRTSKPLDRFIACGEFRHQYAEHLLGAYLDGFNFRVVLKDTAFTDAYKRFFALPEGIANVFVDVKIPPQPARVGDEGTPNELDIAAHGVNADEVAVFGGLVTTVEAPDDLWTRIATGLSLRLLASNSTACVFAAPRPKAGDLFNRIIAGWARLSLRRLG